MLYQDFHPPIPPQMDQDRSPNHHPSLEYGRNPPTRWTRITVLVRDLIGKVLSHQLDLELDLEEMDLELGREEMELDNLTRRRTTLSYPP